MSIKLEKINIEKDESILITIDGSSENSVVIFVSKKGSCVISSPMNRLARHFTIKANKLEELTFEEKEKIIDE